MEKRGGFTLIEVLVAVVILSTGLVVILQGMQTAVKALDVAVDKTRSSFLLHQQLNDLSAAAAAGQDLSELAGEGRFDKPYDRYYRRLKISKVRLTQKNPGAGAVDADDSGVLYDVRLTVRRAGSERSYSVSTLLLEPPPETSEGALPPVGGSGAGAYGGKGAHGGKR